MATYQCSICKNKIEKPPEKCCATFVLCRERVPVCCGREMLEIIDE